MRGLLAFGDVQTTSSLQVFCSFPHQKYMNWWFQTFFIFHSFSRFTNLIFLQVAIYIYIYMYGWWFGTWLLFSPILGMMIQSDFHIFHGSWNHQLDKYMNVLTIYWYTVCTKNSKAMCHSFGQIVDQKVWWFCVQYQPHTHPVQLTKKRVATSSGQSWQWKIRWLKRNIIWINYEDLTETSLEWWLLGVSIPKY